MICKKCSQNNENMNIYCKNCGEKLEQQDISNYDSEIIFQLKNAKTNLLDFNTINGAIVILFALGAAISLYAKKTLMLNIVVFILLYILIVLDRIIVSKINKSKEYNFYKDRLEFVYNFPFKIKKILKYDRIEKIEYEIDELGLGLIKIYDYYGSYKEKALHCHIMYVSNPEENFNLIKCMINNDIKNCKHCLTCNRLLNGTEKYCTKCGNIIKENVRKENVIISLKPKMNLKNILKNMLVITFNIEMFVVLINSKITYDLLQTKKEIETILFYTPSEWLYLLLVGVISATIIFIESIIENIKYKNITYNIYKNKIEIVSSLLEEKISINYSNVKSLKVYKNNNIYLLNSKEEPILKLLSIENANKVAKDIKEIIQK